MLIEYYNDKLEWHTVWTCRPVNLGSSAAVSRVSQGHVAKIAAMHQKVPVNTWARVTEEGTKLKGLV